MSLLVFFLACAPEPAGELTPPPVEDNGGQSGATTAPCGTETRTDVPDPAVPAPDVDYSVDEIVADWSGDWSGAMLDGGAPVTVQVAFDGPWTWVYQETCGGWYEFGADLAFTHPELTGDFTGLNRGSDNRAAISAAAEAGAYTTDLAPTGFDPADYDVTWLAARVYIDNGRLYGVITWEAGSTVSLASTPTTTTEAGGASEEIGWFEAYAVE